MRFLLTTCEGRRCELPEASAWTLTYTDGTPCDSFEVTCPWDGEGMELLPRLCRFTAEEDGEVRFTGVVDEAEYTRDSRGGSLLITGRGMAALLLDNEAESADYQTATLDEILRRHVTPYGITVAEKDSFPAVRGFSIESGQSEWRVLTDFVQYYGGVRPRFDRQGRLVLTGWKMAPVRVLGDDTPVTAWRLRESRYGRLSEVLVRDRVRGTKQTVTDADFQKTGGVCRRVLTMPGRSTGSAMRLSGEYQIAQSKRESRQLEVTLPVGFAAWPGECVRVECTSPPLAGTWRVSEAVCRCGSHGIETVLTLNDTERDG